MLTVTKVSYPNQIDLSVFDGLTAEQVTRLAEVLTFAGFKADSEDLMLYPAKEPNSKCEQFIYIFLFGALEDLDLDGYAEAFAPKKRAKRKSNPDPSGEELTEDTDSDSDAEGCEIPSLVEEEEELQEEAPASKRRSRRQAAS